VFYWLFYLPMAIVGIPVTVFVIILISLVYQFWSHTQLVGKLGWARPGVCNTVENHRCHQCAMPIAWTATTAVP